MTITSRRKPIFQLYTTEEFKDFLKGQDKFLNSLTPELENWFKENQYSSYPITYFYKPLYKSIYGKLPKSKIITKFWTFRGYSEEEAKNKVKTHNNLMCQLASEEMKSLTHEQKKMRYDSNSKEFHKKKHSSNWEQNYHETNKSRTDKSLKNKKQFWLDKGNTEKEADNKVSEIQSNRAKKYWGSEKRTERLIPTQTKYWEERGLSTSEAKQKVSEVQSRFSKEICIAKYGEDIGLSIWNERNVNWYQTLQSTFIENYGVRHYYFKDFKNGELLTKEYIEENFMKNGRMNLSKMENFYSVSRTFLIPELESLGYNKTNFLKETQANEIVEFIHSIYDGEVIIHDRKILNGKELDIYIPELNFAIEYDGLMYHSRGISKYKRFNTPEYDKNYHLNKTNDCEEQGIHLFHIFEDEWIDKTKRDIWKSKIRIKLNKCENRINARDCSVENIEHKDTIIFLEENHLQGSMNSGIRFGLFYQGNLISVFTVGKSRFKNNDIELHRFCTLKDTIVRGGFSKLLSEYMKTYGGDLVSYGNRRWTFLQENIYGTEFNLDNISGPNKFYFDKTFTLKNRIHFQKHKLASIIDNFERGLTEEQNMMLNGYRIIFDSGNIKYTIRR